MSVVDPGQIKLAIEKEGQLPLLTTFDQVKLTFAHSSCKVSIIGVLGAINHLPLYHRNCNLIMELLVPFNRVSPWMKSSKKSVQSTYKVLQFSLHPY